MIKTLGAPPPAAAVASVVTLTINGRQVQARAGQTVLDAATEAGISIPTLCHHPAVSAFGGCRVCVVEIERQRALQPACTFPVGEGLVVATESPRVVAARKFVLEMLFSERPHYCMICPVSGGEHTSDCELQRLAYRYGMTSWAYPPDTSRRWPVDASRPHMVVDHARCVLCRRCIRACHELAASHTLGAHYRGARTMVGADDGVGLGESTCVSCGTCLQVCPTGAIVNRHSAFLGHEADVQRTRTTCMACAVGCPIDTVTRNNRLLAVEGVWDAPNRGVLCEDGRFGVLSSPGKRLVRPRIRRDGVTRECSWDEALDYAAEGLGRAKKVAGLITARSTNETLLAFASLFHDVLRSDQVSLLSGHVPVLGLGAAASTEDVRRSDCVAVIAGDPARTHKVLAYMARHAVDAGARLVVASADPTGLDGLADTVVRLQRETQPAGGGDPHEALRYTYHVRPDRLAEVRGLVEAAERPVVMYGPDLDDELVRALRTLPAKTRFLPLVGGPNAVGAARLGMTSRPVAGDAALVMASDETTPAEAATAPPAGATFTVVQASFEDGWTEAADVALPSKIWFEKQGHVTGFDGRRLTLTRPVDAPEDILNDWQTLFLLSMKLGKPLACVGICESGLAQMTGG